MTFDVGTALSVSPKGEDFWPTVCSTKNCDKFWPVFLGFVSYRFSGLFAYALYYPLNSEYFY